MLNHLKTALALIALSCLYSQTTISVLDFTANGISTNEASILTDRFRAELIQLKEYSVIERAAMKEILDEQGFQQSGCTTDECVVEVGQMLGAQQMVGGSIGRLGDVFTITARIIDVQSGEILKVTTYDHEGDIGSLLKTGMRQLTLDLFTKREVATVKAVVNTGDLYISSNPDGAEIHVDGRMMGYSPLLIEQLEIGEHEISIQLAGYLSLFESVIVKTSFIDTFVVVLDNISELQNIVSGYHSRSTVLFYSAAGMVAVGYLVGIVADNRYEKYQTATHDAEDLINQVELLDTISSASYSIGGTAALIYSYYLIRESLIKSRIKKEPAVE